MEIAAKQQFDPKQLVQQLFNFVFDGSPVCVAVCDAELRFVAVNNAWAAMDGIPAEDHKGKTVTQVLGVTTCPVEAEMIRVLTTGKPIFGLEVTAKIPARSDVGRWIIYLIPLKDKRGKATHIGSITVETTPETGFDSFLVARADTPRHAPLRPHGEVRENVEGVLSPREIEITHFLADGKSNKEISAILQISVKTVEAHRRSIMKNLNFRSAAQLGVYAARNGIV